MLEVTAAATVITTTTTEGEDMFRTELIMVNIVMVYKINFRMRYLKTPATVTDDNAVCWLFSLLQLCRRSRPAVRRIQSKWSWSPRS